MRMLNRKEFIGAALGACGAGGCLTSIGQKDSLDPNLAVFLSDIHCHAKTSDWMQHQHPILKRYVGEILDMRPLPAHVVVFGDFSADVGWVEDFRRAREILAPLSAAGIRMIYGMGNHDKRRNFLEVFPEYADRMLVKDRIVSRFSTPYADFILLDSLVESAGDGGNTVAGRVDGAQLEWLRGELASAKRPLFVGAHHDAEECGIARDLVRAPKVYGYVFGHEHEWNARYLHDGTYGNSQTLQTATLPSAGYYGDVGYAIFRTYADRAELMLRQDDFFFNQAWPGRSRPKNWQQRIEMHRNAKVVFWYDKPENYYS